MEGGGEIIYLWWFPFSERFLSPSIRKWEEISWWRSCEIIWDFGDLLQKKKNKKHKIKNKKRKKRKKFHKKTKKNFKKNQKTEN